MFGDLGSSQAQAAMLVGFFLPLLIAIPLQRDWPGPLRTLVSVAAYWVAGAVVAVAAGRLTVGSLYQSILTVLTLGVVGQLGVWQPSGLTPWIEARTDFRRAASRPMQLPPDVEAPGRLAVAEPSKLERLEPTADVRWAAGVPVQLPADVAAELKARLNAIEISVERLLGQVAGISGVGEGGGSQERQSGSAARAEGDDFSADTVIRPRPKFPPNL